MEDDRKSPRVELSINVDVKNDGAFRRVRSRDVSAGGLFIEMDPPPTVGTEFEVLVRLERNRIIRAGAVVCWVQQAPDDTRDRRGVGVAFCELEKQDRDDLEEVIASLRASSAENEDHERVQHHASA